MPANTTLQVRRDTASHWRSNNPTLLSGEIGWEYDTGFFKIGIGLSWAYTQYAGSIGASSTSFIPCYGDGSDGAYTLSTGAVMLQKDMFYTNLTINGTGALITNGYRIFVSGILDISAAPAGAIQWNGNNGGNSTGSAGGASGVLQTANTVGGGRAGTTGGASTATTGAEAGAVTAQTVGNGGQSSAGGAGGTGTGGAGGVSRAGISPSANFYIRRAATNLIKGTTQIQGSTGGPGGSGGGGDGTNVGGGGGGGGGGAGVLYIYANVINRGASTAVGAIQCKGGTAGNGFTPTGTIVTNAAKGGGGGGSGGGGGWVFILYGSLTGTTATNCIDASGGPGGNGGAPQTNGSGAGTGGNGGSGGGGGTITLFNMVSATGSQSVGSAGSAGGTGTSSTGGTGGTANTLQASL